MTRRIKRQRHRRRRSGSAHDPTEASRTDQDRHELEIEEPADIVGEAISDDEGSGDETNMDDEAAVDLAAGLETDAVALNRDTVGLEKDDSPASTGTVRSRAEDVAADELLADELEDTAADPALEGGAAPRPTRPPVERPDTDGAPVLKERPPEPARTQEDPDHPEAFGRWLRSQRELRGIHLRAIAESSKISLGHLKALETGRFDLLPADVFAKGFLRQYASYLGLDPEEAINFYLAARDHVEEDLDPLGVQPPPRASGIRWVIVALILALVLLGVIWGLRHLSESSDSGNTQTLERAQPTVPAAVPSAVDEPPADPGPASDSDLDSGLDAEAEPADAAPVDESADDAAGVSTDASDGETVAEPVQDGLAAGPGQPTALAQPEQPADVPLRIVLDFSDTCWVSALIDDSETREKVHAQGESLTLDAGSSVELKVGNYRAVEVEVNGMPYDLGSRGRSGSVVRTVLIDLESVRELRSGTGTTS